MRLCRIAVVTAILGAVSACAAEPAAPPVTVVTPPAAPSPPPPAPVAPPAPAPTAEAAASAEPFELGDGIRIRWSDPEGRFSVVRTIRPAPDGSSVTIEQRSGRSALRKTFEREILAELWRLWGDERFDVSGWRSEMCVGHEVRWLVQTGPHRRELCHDDASIRRLAELTSVVQSIMQGP